MSVEKKEAVNLPIVGMLLMSSISMVLVGLSFMVIRYWPVPASVAPYFGGRIGVAWGLIVGAIMGLIIGYCVDDSHFENNQ